MKISPYMQPGLNIFQFWNTLKRFWLCKIKVIRYQDFSNLIGFIGESFQKTVLARECVLFTFDRVWCLLNCGLQPQNSQLLSKQKLLAFNVLSLVLFKEDAWALRCNVHWTGSMNKNTKSEEIPRFVSQENDSKFVSGMKFYNDAQ